MNKLIAILAAAMFGLGSVTVYAAAHTAAQPMKDEMKKADKAEAKTAMSKEEKAKAAADRKAAKAKAAAERKEARAKAAADRKAAKAAKAGDTKKEEAKKDDMKKDGMKK